MFNVGWPEVGNFNLPTIYQVKDISYGSPEYPNQASYITIGQMMMTEIPPKWLNPFLLPSQVVVAVVTEKNLPQR